MWWAAAVFDSITGMNCSYKDSGSDNSTCGLGVTGLTSSLTAHSKLPTHRQNSVHQQTGPITGWEQQGFSRLSAWCRLSNVVERIVFFQHSLTLQKLFTHTSADTLLMSVLSCALTAVRTVWKHNVDSVTAQRLNEAEWTSVGQCADCCVDGSSAWTMDVSLLVRLIFSSSSDCWRPPAAHTVCMSSVTETLCTCIQQQQTVYIFNKKITNIHWFHVTHISSCFLFVNMCEAVTEQV